MLYPPGKHRVWFSRCFEITVHSDERVELDEYESFTAPPARSGKGRVPFRKGEEMYHVGKTVLHLKEGRVVEEKGAGWDSGSAV